MLDNYREMFNGYTLTLDSGIVISMKSLVQQITYIGILEGLPYRNFNDRLVEKLIGKGYHLLYQNRCEPDDEYLRRRDAEFLPYITCMASWTAHTPTRNPEAHLSNMSLVWFQDTWVFPLAPEVVTALKALDWEALAVDCWL